jgi:hypothetical protein
MVGAKTPAKAGKASSRKAAVEAARLIQQQLVDADARLAAGKTLPNHLARLVRDRWLQDLTQYVWPTSAACAADLGISLSTLSAWAGEGAPVPGHSPVSKGDLYRWLYERERTRPGAAAPAGSERDQVDVSIKKATLAAKTGALTAATIDAATTYVRAQVQSLRSRLLQTTPIALIAELMQAIETGADQTTLEAIAAAAIEAALSEPGGGAASHKSQGGAL